MLHQVIWKQRIRELLAYFLTTMTTPTNPVKFKLRIRSLLNLKGTRKAKDLAMTICKTMLQQQSN